MASCLVGPIAEIGIEYLPYITMLSGLIIMLAGVCRAADLLRLVPVGGLVGFLNGLAYCIFIGQLADLQDDNGEWLPSPSLQVSIGLATLVVLLTLLLPYVTTILPSSLVAMVIREMPRLADTC